MFTLMTHRLFLLGFVVLLGCDFNKSLEGHIVGLLDRCWDFAETSDFRGRSLYWVGVHGETRIYEEPHANALIAYRGSSMSDLTCRVYNDDRSWNAKDREDVLSLVRENGKEWVAEHSGVVVNDILHLTRDGAGDSDCDVYHSPGNPSYFVAFGEVSSVVSIRVGKTDDRQQMSC